MMKTPVIRLPSVSWAAKPIAMPRIPADARRPEGSASQMSMIR